MFCLSPLLLMPPPLQPENIRIKVSCIILYLLVTIICQFSTFVFGIYEVFVSSGEVLDIVDYAKPNLG